MHKEGKLPRNLVAHGNIPETHETIRLLRKNFEAQQEKSSTSHSQNKLSANLCKSRRELRS